MMTQCLKNQIGLDAQNKEILRRLNQQSPYVAESAETKFPVCETVAEYQQLEEELRLIYKYFYKNFSIEIFMNEKRRRK